MAEQEPRLTKEEASAGTTPRVTRYVLAISLSATIVLFAVLLLHYH